MFIGHYAAAPLAAATGKIKLWHGFVAVQCVDFIWAGLNLAGIEQSNLVSEFDLADPAEAYFMPYSHSLVYTAFWAVIAGVLYYAFTRRKSLGGPILIALLVVSHWLADVLMHAPILPILPGSEKLGLGLGEHAWISLPIEIGMTLGALLVYVRLTIPVSKKARLWTLLFGGFLAGLQLYFTFAPVPQSLPPVMISALFTFTLIALAAGLYERTRRFCPDT